MGKVFFRGSEVNRPGSLSRQGLRLFWGPLLSIGNQAFLLLFFSQDRGKKLKILRFPWSPHLSSLWRTWIAQVTHWREGLVTWALRSQAPREGAIAWEPPGGLNRRIETLYPFTWDRTGSPFFAWGNSGAPTKDASDGIGVLPFA
ncbi:hypothetical protein MPNT_10088 [Candidatus Methylacidithermus pantelleriae]|uniref:Uncharacterized protein n=1 Tax=Candidatus Methylacidithermus pantelleriae TaxID=2744239 RepID=A0A8J2FMZ4_9BACT|nr:hypothetical protein MPNT_10088 [Candidatus Methylacidithermus pantelleriae]